MNRILIYACITFAILEAEAQCAVVDLGTARSFAVLGGSTVTNTGASFLQGSLGVNPGTAITGFLGTVENDGPGTFSATSHQGDAIALQARTDALASYNELFGLTSTLDLTGLDLGGLTLTPGIYNFDSSAQLTGILTLDGAGNYVFQIGSTLTTASLATISFTNGADPYNDVFWLVGTSATLGVGTIFGGNILADQSNTLTSGASVVGRVIALNGAVTLDNNLIIPEPTTLSILGMCSLMLIRRKRKT